MTWSPKFNYLYEYEQREYEIQYTIIFKYVNQNFQHTELIFKSPIFIF